MHLEDFLEQKRSDPAEKKGRASTHVFCQIWGTIDACVLASKNANLTMILLEKGGIGACTTHYAENTTRDQCAPFLITKAIAVHTLDFCSQTGAMQNIPISTLETRQMEIDVLCRLGLFLRESLGSFCLDLKSMALMASVEEGVGYILHPQEIDAQDTRPLLAEAAGEARQPKH